MTSAKILIIDDYADFREVTALTLLQHFKAEFLYADGATSGVAAISANPDLSLVICDYMMPDKNGEWVCREVTRLKPNLPFILFSSMISQKLKTDFTGLRVRAFVEKSDIKLLTAVVIDVLLNKN